MEDSTFMLIHSSEEWKIEEKEISETTRYDRNKQKYTVVTIPIYQDKNFRPENSHIHEKLTIDLKHASCGNTLIVLQVTYYSYIVTINGKRKRIMSDMPFRVKGCNYTYHFKNNICYLMGNYGITIKRCSEICHTTPRIVKDVNKERLKKLAGDMKPLHLSKHLAVDEFLLEHNHRYCTVVIDADTGELLYLEKGKKQEQLLHFFKWVGDDFMKHVEAISMDMNTNYYMAVINNYPHIEIVYDKFHIIQWYNQTIVDRLRCSEAKRLKKEADKLYKEGNIKEATLLMDERSLLFRARFTLLANKRTLKAKDELNSILNKQAKEVAILEGRDPNEVGKRRVNNVAARVALLDANDKLQTVVRSREELQDILSINDAESLAEQLNKWIALYKNAGITQLTKFTKTMQKRFNGIVSRAKHHISSGIMEGTNAFIKALRRSAFGFQDFDYFALLIWENSHKSNSRRDTLNNIPIKHYHRNFKFNNKRLKQTVYNWKDSFVI